MSNPLFNGQKTNNLSQLKNALDMIKNVQNPQAILQQAAQKNPQLASVMQMCSGRNPQEVFYEMCKQRGVDPESILSQLR